MYIVIELQTSGGVTANIVNAYEDFAVALQAYYTILAAAAVSSVEIHAAVMVNAKGELLRHESFTHKGAD